jgi:hypothetical protein
MHPHRACESRRCQRLWAGFPVFVDPRRFWKAGAARSASTRKSRSLKQVSVFGHDLAARFLLGLRYMSMVDTSPQADARYHELLRRMPAEQRLEAAMRLSQAVRELALAGIRGRHPAADAHELRVRLTVRLYGRDCARRLFGDVPDDAI